MRRSLRAGQRAVVGKAILVLVATLAAVAQSQTSCTAHTQCPNDAGSTRANYCDTRNLCYSCSWGYTPAGGSLSGFSCSFANSFGLVDAVDGVCPEKCTCCEQMVVTGASEVGRTSYDGVYTALPGNLTQGQRTYQGGAGGHYLYFTSSGEWSIGPDLGSRGVRGNTELGWRCPDHNGPWNTYNGTTWAAAPSIRVECAPCAAFLVVTGAELHQLILMGQYALLNGITRGDRPVWRSTDLNTVRYIFYASSGRWAMGADYDSTAAGIAASTAAQAGCPEDVLSSRWSVYTGTDWATNYTVVVTPASSLLPSAAPTSPSPTGSSETHSPSSPPTMNPTKNPTNNPTSPPTTRSNAAFGVTSGFDFCHPVGANCVHDGGNYGTNELCTITVVNDGGTISSAGTFDVEYESSCTYDYVQIGPRKYCGATGPTDVAVDAGETVTWRSDGSFTGAGWTICWTATPPPTPPPTPAPTDPTPSPSPAPTTTSHPTSPPAYPPNSATAGDSKGGTDDDDGSDATMIVASVLGGLLVLMLILAVVVQRQRRKSDDSMDSASNAAPSDDRTGSFENPQYDTELSPVKRAVDNPIYGDGNGRFAIKRVHGSVHGPGKSLAKSAESTSAAALPPPVYVHPPQVPGIPADHDQRPRTATMVTLWAAEPEPGPTASAEADAPLLRSMSYNDVLDDATQSPRLDGVIERQSMAAITIQAIFRGHLTRKGIVVRQIAATLIQKYWKCYQFREVFRMSKEEQILRAEKIQHKYNALDICKEDIIQYTSIFQKVRTSQSKELAGLAGTVADIKQRLPDAEGQRQPTEIDGKTDTKTAVYLIELGLAFQNHDRTIFVAAKAVADELGHTFIPGPDKTDDRQVEKAKNAYDGDYSLLKDLRRASIVCKNIAEINDTILRLEADDGINICRIKNRFDRNYNAKDASAGYRDLQLNVVIPETGLIWELQIHLEAIEELKSKLCNDPDASGRTGHGRFIEYRTIMERL